jgi:hypothetical protein
VRQLELRIGEVDDLLQEVGASVWIVKHALGRPAGLTRDFLAAINAADERGEL